MTDRLSLPPRYRRMVEALLREHVPNAEVWAYGSRVNGEGHDGSDLDLVVRGPTLEPLGIEFIELVEALQESNIPILVQAHDWARLPDGFHREIDRDYVVVQSHGQGEWREAVWGELVTLEYGKALRGYRSSDGRYKVYGTNGPIAGTVNPYVTRRVSSLVERERTGVYITRLIRFSSLTQPSICTQRWTWIFAGPITICSRWTSTAWIAVPQFPLPVERTFMTYR